MKKLILFSLLLVFASASFSQTKFPSGVIVGPTATPMKATVTKILSNGTNIGFYSGSTLLNPLSGDTVSAGAVLVMKADSSYRKPGSYTSRYDFKNEYTPSPLLKVMKDYGSVVKLLPIACEVGNSGASGALSDGIVYYLLTKVTDTITITSLAFTNATPGVYTGDNYNGVGIYAISGNTATLVRSSTNNLTLWTGASNTNIVVPLSSPIVLNPGFYFLASLYNHNGQTTAPSVHGVAMPSWAQYGFALPNSTYFMGYSSATQTALPATVTLSTQIYPTTPIPCLLGR